MKRTIVIGLILCILVNIFMGVSVSADAGDIEVIADGNTREVYIKGITSRRSTLTVFYPDSDEVALSQSNLADKIVYMGEVNGAYNECIILPESAPYGEYTIKETSKGVVKTAAFEYAESSEHTIFEESFDGTVLWNTSEMCTVEGALTTTSDSNCSAYIKGDYDSLPSNATYTVDFSLDYPDKDAWFMFEFRKSAADAERLLVRKERTTIYNPDNVGNTEKGFLSYNTLLKNENYKLIVEAFGYLIKVKVLDSMGNVLAFGSYTTDCVSGGGFGFRTYGLTARVDSISVSEKIDDGLHFSKKILALPKSDVMTVSILNSADTATYTSSDSSVATVDESTGEITGVSNGTAIITATSSTDNDDLCVVVYSEPQTIALSEQSVTLREGEMISVSVTSPTEKADLSSLIWESSDESVAYDFGMLPNTRTIVANNAGSAVISVRDSLTGVVANMAVNVIPAEEKGCISAAFELGEGKQEIDDNVFGIANNFTQSVSAKDLIDELGFNMIRSFPPADGNFTSDTYFIANSLGLPNMTVLTFHNQTIDEIVEDVGQMVDSIENNNPVYIEFGNELYDGSAGMTADQYVTKCKEAYAAVKNAYPDVKIGVPLYSTTSTNNAWNTTLLANQDYYDAVVIHNYKAIFDVDGRTQAEAMSFIYSEARRQQKVTENINNLAPTKEIWISEYGFLLQDLFNQSFSAEKNRMQFAKSVGVALANMEQTMDMLCDGITDMAAYWYLNDAQGFGIMQDGTTLHNYYTFKELSRILEDCNTAYRVETLYSKPIDYALTRGHGSTYNAMNAVEAWGFGDENGQKYIVFSNRTENPALVDFNGFKLKKVWQYGGNDDILDDYLIYSVGAGDVPPNVPVPETFEDNSFENFVNVNKFSIVVCEVQENDSVVSISSNVVSNPERWDFDRTGGLTITAGAEIDSVSLIADGVSCNAIYTQIAENTYSVKPEGGWEYSTSYNLTVNIGNIQKSYEFTTVDAPEYTRYIHNYSLSDSKYSDWTDVGITTLLGKKWTLMNGVLTKHNDGFHMATLDKNDGYKNGYIDFTLDFSENVSSTGNKYCQMYLRNGFIRVSASGIVYTYFNGKNDKVIGRIADFGTDPIDVRVILSGDKIEVYSKKTTEEFYSYVGEDNNIKETTRKLAFAGEGKYSISDIECYESDNAIENVRLYQSIGNDDVEISSIANGTNKVSVTVEDDISEHTVMMALYKNSALVECQKSDADGNTHSFEFKSAGDDIDEMKLFVWSSLETCEPLDKMHYFVKY